MALPLPSTPPSGPSRAPLLPFGSTSPEDDWHDAISSPKLESFSRFVSEDSVTSINVLNMSELERSQTEPPLTPKSSLPSTPAAVSRAASPVGSGPSRMVSRWHRVSGYRTPSTASGFVRCWGGSERNSPRRPSYSMSPEERRLSVEGLDEQSRKQVEETKRNLESCIADMALQPISDLRLEKFRPLVTSLTRMERHFRRESPEALIGHLEPKVTVLNFILELHRAKRTYRRQTGSCLNVLLQSRSWFDTFCAHNFHRKAPEDLLNLPALRKPVSLQVPEVKQPEDEEAPSPLPIFSPVSPTRHAAVEAEAKAYRERRQRRATRRSDEGVPTLLLCSKDQAEALQFTASGDSEEVQVAFETFHRAVRQAANAGQAQLLVDLANFEPKKEMATFLADIAVKRKIWRSRAAWVLAKLSEMPSWKAAVEASEALDLIDALSPKAAAASPASSRNSLNSPQHSEPEPEYSDKSLAQDGSKSSCLSPKALPWQEKVRRDSPWYLHMFFKVIGVECTLRFCKCLVPRHIQSIACIASDVGTLPDQLMR